MSMSTTTEALLALSASTSGSDGIMAPSLGSQGHVPSRAVVGAIESAVLREQIRQQMPSTPGSAVTSGDDASDWQQPQQDACAAGASAQSTANGQKKRKPTYYMRKDEMAELQDEIAVLTAKLKKMEAQPQYAALVDAVDRNADMQNHVRQGHLAIATAQSLMGSHEQHSRSPPLGGFIHLPRDPAGRVDTLMRLKMPRLHEAIRYALVRSQFLDAAKFSRQIETFETDTGDFVTTHWEITPLEEARSVEHAYRELQYFTETQEISMSEKLGVLSIREGESDHVDGTQAVRMLSKHETGVQSDTNLAVFSHLFEESEMLKQPHALVVIDFIDQDDLYPQQPRTRIRKDVASLTMITEAPSTTRGGCPVVTMVRWAFVRVNNNPYTNRRELESIARDGVAKWCDVMLKCIRDRLAWQS